MFKPGERVFLPGSSGEPTALLNALFSSGADVTTSFVPGVNTIPVDRACDVTSLFGQTGTTALPCSYGAFARDLGRRISIDTAIVQVSQPDARGRVSLGPAVEFSRRALSAAGRRIGVVNASVAFSAGSPTLAITDFDLTVESDTSLPQYFVDPTDPTSNVIAGFIAGLVEDGAALQVGLGKVPSALLALLTDRRRLRLRSGMLSNGVEALDQAGALDPDWPHLTTVFLGDDALYDWAAEQSTIRVTGCEDTHDPAQLARVDGLLAVNSALQVDLLGQCNLEYAGGRQVSGCGGAPDFARAARLSTGGLSIVALPSSFPGGSRIVARLEPGAAVAIPRHDVDVIVTEQGVADLRGKDVTRRAEAILAVAAPETRDTLHLQWVDMARRSQDRGKGKS